MGKPNSADESNEPFFRSMPTSTFSVLCSSWFWNAQRCHPDRWPSDWCVHPTTMHNIWIKKIKSFHLAELLLATSAVYSRHSMDSPAALW